ncbi:MAG: type IV pilus assembly protein PilX, partial [uncultured bacterium]
VSSRDDTVHPRHVPAMYNLSVQGVREEAGSREKARLSVLYAY